MYLDGVGLRAPGLNGWAAASGVLAGDTPYAALPIEAPDCELLPPAERRRAVASVKLALAVATEVSQVEGIERSQVATVFASSAGDSRTLDEIMRVLAAPPREMSPTRFHNSVHNAPSGYWHIASACREPSTSIGCHDASFVAGLLEAAAQIATDQHSLLLIAYDLPYPAPLDSFRPIKMSFATALHLTPSPTPRTLAWFDVELKPHSLPATRMIEPELEDLRSRNPAARSLPVLSMVARRESGTIYLDYIAGNCVGVSIGCLNGQHFRAGDSAGQTTAIAR
jgi:hypothetical protein